MGEHPSVALAAIENLLSEQFNTWESDPGRYLELDWKHYRRECPPVLFVGGRTVPSDARVPVVVSIEPLEVDDHFGRQVAYAGKGIERFCKWNLDFFATFPSLAGQRPQAYWRNMTSFIAGWARDAPRDANDPWAFLGRSMMELPYIPMHAKKHKARASARAAATLRELFVARASAVTEMWPNAVFVVLAASIKDRLNRGRLLVGMESVKLPESASQRAAWGKYFDVPISRGHLAIPARPPVFVRNGPFSNWTNPKAEGRRRLGELLRADVDRREGAPSK